jgi:predicted nucleic acid-binding protein
VIYLDTSAAFKVLTEEPERQPLVEFLDATSTEGLVTSVVTEVEMHRSAHLLSVPAALVDEVLSRLALVEMTSDIRTRAGLLPDPTLRSLDAIHIATALDTGIATFVTYDRRQAAAAADLGLRVERPC